VGFVGVFAVGGHLGLTFVVVAAMTHVFGIVLLCRVWTYEYLVGVLYEVIHHRVVIDI